MEKEIKHLSFSKLRQAYNTVKEFIENETGENIKSLNTKIADDLGLWGDDNDELLTKFIKKFNLDAKDFNYHEHFESEYEVFGSGRNFLMVLSIILQAPLKLIEILSFNKIDFGLKVFQPWKERQLLDLSFRDLLTWYIEGQFKLGTQIKYDLEKVKL